METQSYALMDVCDNCDLLAAPQSLWVLHLQVDPVRQPKVKQRQRKLLIRRTKGELEVSLTCGPLGPFSPGGPGRP